MLGGPGRALYRALSARCDRVIVHTRAAQAMLTGAIGLPGRQVTVIPHPRAKPPRAGSTPPDLRARFGLGNAELLIAFGFVHVDKGLGDLVRALRMLRASGTPLEGVRLVIAGTVRPRTGLFRLFELRDRAHLAGVMRLARRGGLDGLIVRTGYVPEADIAGWFQAAAAIVLPYRRTEGSGVAGIAATFAVPVLASTAGGLGEQYADGQWTFPPRAPRQLSHVLRRFLATAPQRRGAPAAGLSPAAGPAPSLGLVVAATLDAYREAAPWILVADPAWSVPDAR
jgi:glycosyltransferase involved in cell wall biosynthesis